MNDPVRAVLLLLLTALLAWATPSVHAQKHRFRVVQYNVENLFDTCHAAGHADAEFTPTAERRWDSRRYWAKLSRLGRAIAAAGGDAPAALVALCEVENDSVARDLTRRTLLTRLGYKYLITHSRDARGMNVALLYQPELFLPVEKDSLRIPFDIRRERPTRDILHVAGELQSGDTLDVFVCHLPSRRGGSARTDAYRRRATRLLRRATDSIAALRHRPALLVMGDFNDEPRNGSLRKELAAVLPPGAADTAACRPERLYLLSAHLKAPGGVEGTYKFQGRWNRLDHILVNGSLLRPGGPLLTSAALCRIYAPHFLIEPDPSDGGVKPDRTYLGPFYHGGLSDHLPLVLDLWW